MCDICSKTFKRKEALDNHAIVHKDLPKDFKCVTCGAAFNSQQYLNRHISRHFAEKKHKCRDCDMAFIDRRDYVVHINKVCDLYPFSSQFYIQLVFKAPLCITLTISDQKIVSGSLFFQLFSTFSKKKKKIIKAILCNFSMRLLKYF